MSKQSGNYHNIFRIVMISVVLSILLGACEVGPSGSNDENAVQILAMPLITDGEFKRITGPLNFSFPLDHGAHSDYQTEWWYYTGNLSDPSGRHFGYQLTFFRRGLIPPKEQADATSDWRMEQVYFAHFTISDISGDKYSYQERFSRGAAGLAGARGDPEYSVWLEDWQVLQVGSDTYRLRAEMDHVSLNLTLTDEKGPVLQGDHGYSQKGTDPGNASAYFSQTRLVTSGEIQLNDELISVSGLSWMDHEFSTSALGAGLTGWDWFSMQFDDGSEVMLFILRREDGSLDSYSAGTWIAADGTTRALSENDFSISVTANWKSPHSEAVYPAAWKINVPDLDLSFSVKPLLADQELNLSFTYWEGAVAIQGERDGKPVHGFGYVELTGYAKSMQGQF